MRRSILLAAAAVVLVPAALVQPAAASTVSADVGGYTAIGTGVIPDTDWTHITVTHKDGPNHAEASGSGGQFQATHFGPGLNDVFFTSAGVEGFASADPGILHVFGSDLAIATSVNGLIQGENHNTVYTNISAGASFSDVLTVKKTGAAAGTPEILPLNFVVEFVTGSALDYPVYSAHAISVYARFDLPGYGPQIFYSDSGYFPATLTYLSNGHYLYTIRGEAPISTFVGAVLPIDATFGVYGQANITDYDRQNGQFGNFADGRDTSALWFGDLPAGVVITSESGHDYSLDPRLPVVTPPSGVPEPATWTMLLLGLFGVSFIARGRRSVGPSRIS